MTWLGVRSKVSVCSSIMLHITCGQYTLMKIMLHITCGQYTLMRIMLHITCDQYTLMRITLHITCGQYTLMRIMLHITCGQYTLRSLLINHTSYYMWSVHSQKSAHQSGFILLVVITLSEVCSSIRLHITCDQYTLRSLLINHASYYMWSVHSQKSAHQSCFI